MKKIGAALVVVVMVFGFAAAAQAQHGPPGAAGQNPPAWQNQPPMLVSIDGQVTCLTGNTVVVTGTVHGQQETLVLTINSATQIGAANQSTKGRGHSMWRQGNGLTTADLEVGDIVKVFFNVDTNVAQVITITYSPGTTGTLT